MPIAILLKSTQAVSANMSRITQQLAIKLTFVAAKGASSL
jgi:hypothetical protein